MDTTRLRTAIIGTGFMGRVHLEAVRRLGSVDVAAVAGSTVEKARGLADEFGVERATDDYRALLQDPAIHAVHICTPNAEHFPMASAALHAGKHVLCEKPLAMTSAQAADLVALAEGKNLRNCICHNLRYYPLVQHMRRMREGGELGDILIAQGTYSQDWLLYDTDWNWRVDPAAGGALRAMGDIGSHWSDMVEHVTGLKITSMCCDRRHEQHHGESHRRRLRRRRPPHGACDGVRRRFDTDRSYRRQRRRPSGGVRIPGDQHDRLARIRQARRCVRIHADLLPKNKSLEQVRTELTAAIKAAAPSYGVFSPGNLNTYSEDAAADATWKDAIAPLARIPKASERSVPQYLTCGTEDRLISNASVTEFVDALAKAGQRVEYVQVGGAGHAFFDWKPDANTKATFGKYGVYYAAEMKAFFGSVLY